MVVDLLIAPNTITQGKEIYNELNKVVYIHSYFLIKYYKLPLRLDSSGKRDGAS